MSTSDPVLARDRFLGLDFARGLAIVGMVTVHFLLTLLPSWGADEGLLAVLDGRPATLFVILAGVGVALANARRRESGAPVGRLRSRLWRRGLLLLALGFLNLVVWPGDILRVYGFTFLIALPFLDASPRRHFGIFLAFVVGFVALIATVDYGDRWNWETLEYEGLWTAAGLFRNFFFEGFRAVLPWSGLFFLGLALGASGVRDPRRWLRWIMVGLSLWIGAELLSHYLLDVTASDPEFEADPELAVALFGTLSMPPLPIFLAASIGCALTILGLSSWFADRFPRFLLVRLVTALGQVAFTAYVVHIYAGVLILYGLDLHTEHTGLAVGGALLYCVALATWAAWLRARGGRGPCERLLRHFDP